MKSSIVWNVAWALWFTCWLSFCTMIGATHPRAYLVIAAWVGGFTCWLPLSVYIHDRARGLQRHYLPWKRLKGLP